MSLPDSEAGAPREGDARNLETGLDRPESLGTATSNDTSNRPFAIARARDVHASFSNGTTTLAEMHASAQEPGSVKGSAPYLPGTLKGTSRTRDGIASRSAVTLDYDHPDPRAWGRAIALGYAALLHTTHSSTREAPRFRVLLSLDREVSADEYAAAARGAAELIGTDGIDPASYVPTQPMFGATVDPAHRDDYSCELIEGPLASADELMTAAPAEEVRQIREAHKRDPYTLPGVVGAFNRAYSLEDAIAEFSVPYESVSEGLWILKGSTHEPGVRELAPGVIYSHHATDPAWDQALTAFDLVAVHRYGHQDAELAEPGTPPHRRPSTLSLTEDVEEDPRVLAELSAGEMASLDDFEDLGAMPRDFEGDPEVTSSWDAAGVAEIGEILDAYAAGTLTRIRPEVGRLESPEDDVESRALFYRGRTNGLAGDSNAGKSWTGLEVSRQELAAGSAVVYVDFEDDLQGILVRLLDIGTDPALLRSGRFAYVQPSERFDDPRSRYSLRRALDRLRPSLVVIDSTGEALSMEGTRPNEDDEVAKWFRLLPRYASRHECAPAVVVLDHVTKSDGGLWPIGSQRKRAAISGAQYMQSVREPFSRTRDGSAALKCAKDRHGNYFIGQEVAELRVTTGRATRLELLEITPPEDSPRGEWRPTEAMEAISEYLARNEEVPAARGQNKVVANVFGRKETLREALALLQRDGYVRAESAPRNGVLYSLVRPYPDPFGEEAS